MAEELTVAPQKPTTSAESDFRMLDDAFLQKQARIWVGEVLQLRFDDHINISDLLSDGELLFEVSEAISKMLPTLSMDDTQLRVYDWKSLPSNKSARRYMPYYNLDSFLRMCKNLGMDGIDLFTPSDVVEKRNTRKVCMCLRSLSKKAKSRAVNVPDFDSVTCTLAMPTDKVEYIRKSLEMSQSSTSLSVEHEAENASRFRILRRMSDSASSLGNRFSYDCDEAESCFVVDESLDYAYDAESPNLLVSLVKNEDDDQCEYLSPSLDESVGSPCSQYYSDEDFSVSSSDCQGSRISGKVPESDINHVYSNHDLSHVPLDWGDSHLGVGVYKDGNSNVSEVNYVSHDKDDTDTACSHCHISGNDLSNGYLETSSVPSKIDLDKNLVLAEPPEFAVNGGFHAGEAQSVSHGESLICEVGPDIGKLHPDMKSSEKDLSNELAEQNSNVYRSLENPDFGKLICEVGLDIGKLQSDMKSSEKDLLSELAEQNSNVYRSLENPDFSEKGEYHTLKACIKGETVGNGCCSDGLCNAHSSVEGSSGQFYEEKAPRSIDCDVENHFLSSFISVKSNDIGNHWDHVRNVDHNRESVSLLLEVDTIICGDGNSISGGHSEQQYNKGLTDGNVINLLDIPQMDINSSNVVLAKFNTKCSKDCDEGMEGSKGHNTLCTSVNGKPINIDNIILVDAVGTSTCDLQLEAQSPKNGDDTSHMSQQCVEKGQSGLLKQEGPDKELPLTKPPRKLLKSLVKGTALVGLAVFLLHLRKNRRESHSEAKKQPTSLVKRGTPRPSQKSGGIITGVYPAEKLQFGI